MRERSEVDISGIHVQGAILGVSFLLSRGFSFSFWARKFVDAGNCCCFFGECCLFGIEVDQFFQLGSLVIEEYVFFLSL